MLVVLFKLEALAWCPIVGLAMAAVSGLYFILMMIYAIVAECCDYPMPLDDRCLIGKINIVIMEVLMIGGLIFSII